MLVLSRKESQRIQIGNNITITVIEIRGNKVRLGIDAPKNVAIDREEVAEMKRCELFLESLREETAMEQVGYADYSSTQNPTCEWSSTSPL